MKIHLIGMGEPTMGDLAVALCKHGHTVTGSDVYFSGSMFQRLATANLVPERFGWSPEKIQQGLDKVIVGRTVYRDNPELQAAQQLGSNVYSYPAYIYEYAKDKQRIVISGGKGKERTLLCILLIHVLRHCQKEFDYVVPSPALSTGVQLSDAPIILLEGDEAPSAAIDLLPSSLRYQHNILLLGSSDWEASDSYPTLEAYLKYVTSLADASPKGGVLIFCGEDKLIQHIGNRPRLDVKNECYVHHPYRHSEHHTYLSTPQGKVFFPHQDLASMRAVSGAQQLVRHLAINDLQFYEALACFSS